ncbi:MAG: protein kinase [FCB group bacterium]|nr:protein kinase [FCB group bacterium]
MTDLNDDKTRTHTVLTQGTRVSHYLIIEKIGAGGMGEVYLAEDTKLDRKIALKFLPTHLCQDDDCRARFKREAQAAAKLDHSNIVPIYDAEEFQGRPFIAMAYIEGALLRDRIKENNISINDAITYTRQICEGLKEAHQAGVVHRDIKPGNIIIDNSNKARLLDFGLATIQGTDKLTKVGSTLGTVGYMSPEQICGDEVEARSDLFSVGVILYEMITGRPPFSEEYEAATMNAILNKAPDPLTRYKANIPDELQHAVFKLLEKDSSLRYQSAAGLLSDLKRMEVSTVEKSKETPSRKDHRQKLVVMPFENLGPSEEEYFADGMTEEIISRLATIRELGVISRTSAMTYKQTTKSIREIGSELGVDYVLEGSVRWNRKGKNTDRVRITPQLIRVSDDIHLWSDRYDRTLDDIFEVQTQIAEHVVEQLNIQLVGSKRNVLQAKPTDNLDAYQFYLRGLEYAGRPDYAQQDFRMAQQMFERAVELDPKFALAYVDLSRTHSLLYFHGYDRGPDCVSRARMAVERANSLKPEMAEVHLAFGYFHYYCKQNLELAFEELDKVRKYFPNDSRVLSLTGAIVKRQGRIAEAVEYYKKAFDTSPRDASLPHEIGCAYMTMREYSKADHYYNLSISISNSQVSVFVCKAWNFWLWQGDVSKGRETLIQIPDGQGRELFDLFQAQLFGRNYDKALKTLAAAPEIYDVGQWYLVPKAQFKAYAYQLLGDNEQARSHYESAREFLEGEVEKRPNDDRTRASLGNVYAGLGRAEEAIHEAKLAVELMPISENAVVGPFRVEDLAYTYTLLEEYDAAIDQLEYLMSIPSWISAPLLRIDPRWDPIRNCQRFQTLLKKYDRT